MECGKRTIDDGWSHDSVPVSKLVAIRKADVPEYLHQSQFYKSLDDNDGNILVPQNCVKPNDFVESGDDLYWLLLTLRFWIADPLIEPVLDYVFSNSFEAVNPILSAFHSEFPDLLDMKFVLLEGGSMFHAIESGVISFVKYLLRKGHCWSPDVFELLVEREDMDMIKCALETGYVLGGYECEIAAHHGHLECLKFLHEEAHCPWDIRTPHYAVRGRNLDCLIYAHEHGCPWNASGEEWEIWSSTAKGGCYNICTIAAMYGAFDCLQYAHSQGVPLLADMLRMAAAHTKGIDCFRYGCENGVAFWPPGLYRLAVINDNLPLLQYLHEENAPWDGNGNGDCTVAVKYGHFDCLQYLHEIGFPWNAETCDVAVQKGNVDILLYLLRNDCPVCDHLWALEPCDAFADLVQCFVDRGLAWDLTPEATLDCLCRSNIPGLELLVKHGCPWHPRSFHCVIHNSDFELFQQLHEMGAPWPEDICERVAEKGLVAWLEYAHTHGAVVPPYTCAMLLQLLECFQFAHHPGGCVLRGYYVKQVHRLGEILVFAGL